MPRRPVTQVYGADSYMQYYPLFLYSMVPIVASSLFDFLAVALNEFEEHSTPVRKKNALVIKVCLSTVAPHQGTAVRGACVACPIRVQQWYVHMVARRFFLSIISTLEKPPRLRFWNTGPPFSVGGNGLLYAR